LLPKVLFYFLHTTKVILGAKHKAKAQKVLPRIKHGDQNRAPNYTHKRPEESNLADNPKYAASKRCHSAAKNTYAHLLQALLNAPRAPRILTVHIVSRQVYNVVHAEANFLLHWSHRQGELARTRKQVPRHLKAEIFNLNLLYC
jgi:hypothetical protein